MRNSFIVLLYQYWNSHLNRTRSYL